MKNLIDWSQRKDGQEDTTGWSKQLLANYVSISAIAGNPSWKKGIKTGAITVTEYQNVSVELMKWIFSEHTEEDVLATMEMAKEYWTAANRASPEDFKFGDSVLESAGKRKFRASPVLRSLVVHLGIADFQKSEFDQNHDMKLSYPNSLEVNWNESWSNFRTAKFKDLVSLLRRQVAYDSLVVKVGNESHVLCAKANPTNLVTQNGNPSNSEGRVSQVNDLEPKIGPGNYLLYYGPPGTGKTREANRHILSQIGDQLETSSEGEIRKTMLQGTWSPAFRNKVLHELRKFVTVCQFHSTYSYEDFIEGLRPLPGESGDVRYEVVDGSFLAIWKKAIGQSANLKGKLVSDGDEYLLELDPYFIRLYDLDVEKRIELFFPSLNEYFSGVHKPASNWIRLDMTPEVAAKLMVGKLIPVSIKGASWSPDNEYFVLIDELNRGKVAKIFGELLFAMSVSEEDKYPEVRTQYSKTPLILVKNLSLIGTMNSCDKSVDVLDQALKRRFELHELMPLTKSDINHEITWKTIVENFESAAGINLADMLDGLNKRILEHQIDYDRQVGHSFMFKMNTEAKVVTTGESDPEKRKDMYLRSVFKVYFSDIFPVLQDFFLDQRDILEKFVPKGFLSPNSFALQANVRRLVTVKNVSLYDDDAWEAIKDDFQKTIEGLQGRPIPMLRSA